MDNALSGVPKWAWGVAAAVVIVAILLARRGMASGGGGVSPTVTPVPYDPNVAATDQAAIAGKTNAFQSLTDAFFGYRAAQVGAARDVNVAGIGGATDVATTSLREFFGTERTKLMEAGYTTRTMLQEAGQTSRTGLMEAGQTRRTDISETMATSRNYTNAQTNLSIADIQAALNKYLGDISLQTEQNRNRTALSIQESMAGVQRQASTNQAITSGIKSVCSGVVSFLTLGLGHC